jgi:hypothetical protein
MLLWIAQDTHTFLGKTVSSHCIIAAPTPMEAATAIRKGTVGRIEVAGYILDGRTHYYATPLAGADNTYALGPLTAGVVEPTREVSNPNSVRHPARARTTRHWH